MLTIGKKTETVNWNFVYKINNLFGIARMYKERQRVMKCYVMYV